jgi:hypothetical protein
MDKELELLYKGIYSLDTTKCVEVTTPIDNLEFRMGTDIQDFKKFVDEYMHVVTIDKFSTKEIAEKNPQFKDKYMEMYRLWGIFTYPFLGESEVKKTPIGYGYNLQLYNGFPFIIKPEKFIENPSQEFENGMKEMLSNKEQAYLNMISKPVTTTLIKFFFLPDFYEKYICEKILGGK